ncbi:RagB/SusD family nutrient uptake outer membrane protein [uncultured Draconibacterium sp.]|uniref:RagB/SusD family nutrient uptake outer membrane protein n=1 Tax=uncultured Draconibacterium sp. TaxID=1573823 RepID=UPI0029C6C5A1|nr:RagB/SusD family nutrient uptake outer membrane protein [uncultured Draconibacterium sp.]
MKNKLRILFIAAFVGTVLFGTTSCDNEEFLTVDHYTILAADQMFKSEDDAAKGLVGCYDMFFPGDNADDWNYKPQLFVGCHPTLETQATGWDKQYGNQQWAADDPSLNAGWMYAYRAIGRCNVFLAGLEASEEAANWSTAESMAGQAKAIRAYFYMWLAQTWGRVPMLAAGETFSNTPDKAAAETDDEMWDFIIQDLKDASLALEWAPQNNELGRCTKGMALSYLGEAYMWKAYKARINGDGDAKSNENIQLAADALKEVIDDGPYELAPSYSTLWDVGLAWPKEAVFQVVMDMGAGNYSNWDSNAHNFVNFFAGSTNGGGGWGSQYLSWELYFSFEDGDKRRDASMATNPVPELPEEQRSEYCYGYNPFLQQTIGNSATPDVNSFKMNNGGDYAPGIWTIKLWRNQRCQWASPHSPVHFYYKRYSGVMLDYAECLFRLNGGNDATAWDLVNQVRDRAFGNLEVGKAEALTSTFLPYFQSLENINGEYSDYVAPTEYPIPFSTETVEVPDAKTYYTADAAGNEYHQAFSGLEVWEVALGQERRKEFNSEWNLKYDLQRSDFLIPHIEANYPKGVGVPNTDVNALTNWHTYREWDFNEKKLVMPIPTNELLRNKLITQNDGY